MTTRRNVSLADILPGDLIEHRSGFAWVMLRVEPVTRMFKWAPIPSRTDLDRVPLKPRWSPPHDKESWHANMDVIVRRYA